jgi:hypothetical protein
MQPGRPTPALSVALATLVTVAAAPVMNPAVAATSDDPAPSRIGVDEGRYRVRVVLFQDGDRDLRVVANPAGHDIRSARGHTVVRVWDPAQR